MYFLLVTIEVMIVANVCKVCRLKTYAGHVVWFIIVHHILNCAKLVRSTSWSILESVAAINRHEVR